MDFRLELPTKFWVNKPYHFIQEKIKIYFKMAVVVAILDFGLEGF